MKKIVSMFAVGFLFAVAYGEAGMAGMVSMAIATVTAPIPLSAE